jgi:hypothetical protein
VESILRAIARLRRLICALGSALKVVFLDQKGFADLL